MKTFEGFKADALELEEHTRDYVAGLLSKEGLKENEIRGYTQALNDQKNKIKNIDELAVIKLGATTNNLIDVIKQEYRRHITEYWGSFEKFITDYIIGKTPDGHTKPGSNAAGREDCEILGITLEDLMCFKGHDPLSDEMCDAFRQYININFGSNIPLSSAVKKVQEDYDAVLFEADSAAKDEIYVRFQEIARDSGAKKSDSVTYHFLADNKYYQAAKARCAERNIQM